MTENLSFNLPQTSRLCLTCEVESCRTYLTGEPIHERGTKHCLTHSWNLTKSRKSNHCYYYLWCRIYLKNKAFHGLCLQPDAQHVPGAVLIPDAGHFPHHFPGTPSSVRHFLPVPTFSVSPLILSTGVPHCPSDSPMLLSQIPLASCSY